MLGKKCFIFEVAVVSFCFFSACGKGLGNKKESPPAAAISKLSSPDVKAGDEKKEENLGEKEETTQTVVSNLFAYSTNKKDLIIRKADLTEVVVPNVEEYRVSDTLILTSDKAPGKTQGTLEVRDTQGTVLFTRKLVKNFDLTAKTLISLQEQTDPTTGAVSTGLVVENHKGEEIKQVPLVEDFKASDSIVAYRAASGQLTVLDSDGKQIAVEAGVLNYKVSKKLVVSVKNAGTVSAPDYQLFARDAQGALLPAAAPATHKILSSHRYRVSDAYFCFQNEVTTNLMVFDASGNQVVGLGVIQPEGLQYKISNKFLAYVEKGTQQVILKDLATGNELHRTLNGVKIKDFAVSDTLFAYVDDLSNLHMLDPYGPNRGNWRVADIHKNEVHLVVTNDYVSYFNPVHQLVVRDKLGHLVSGLPVSSAVNIGFRTIDGVFIDPMMDQAHLIRPVLAYRNTAKKVVLRRSDSTEIVIPSPLATGRYQVTDYAIAIVVAESGVGGPGPGAVDKTVEVRDHLGNLLLTRESVREYQLTSHLFIYRDATNHLRMDDLYGKERKDIAAVEEFKANDLLIAYKSGGQLHVLNGVTFVPCMAPVNAVEKFKIEGKAIAYSVPAAVMPDAYFLKDAGSGMVPIRKSIKSVDDFALSSVVFIATNFARTEFFTLTTGTRFKQVPITDAYQFSNTLIAHQDSTDGNHLKVKNWSTGTDIFPAVGAAGIPVRYFTVSDTLLAYVTLANDLVVLDAAGNQVLGATPISGPAAGLGSKISIANDRFAYINAANELVVKSKDGQPISSMPDPIAIDGTDFQFLTTETLRK